MATTPVPQELGNAGAIALQKSDLCEQQIILAGIGIAETTETVISKDLSTAKFIMSVDLISEIDGSATPVTVNMSFRATAKATIHRAREVVVVPGFRTLESSDVEERIGVSTGTVILGGETVLTPNVTSQTSNVSRAVTKDKVGQRPVK